MTNSDTSNTHKHPKTPTNTHKTPTNTHKEWCYHTFVKEWMKALDKTRILAPSDYFYHFSFPRYGRLKSKFLCERYSHCIFSSCSIDLTKTRYTWSLTAVLSDSPLKVTATQSFRIKSDPNELLASSKYARPNRRQIVGWHSSPFLGPFWRPRNIPWKQRN